MVEFVTMQNHDYSAPVRQLLTRGDPRPSPRWPDYRALGIGEQDIPELIRMVTDAALNDAPGDSPAVWAPLHAWRALGQLHAAAAVEPLLTLLQRIDENHDDWVGEELPEVFGLIGPAAIPALTAYLANQKHPTFARAAASRGLGEIARLDPAVRAACVAAISRQLEHFAEQDDPLNGLLVAGLLDLHAAEAAPVIKRAFAAGAVDEMVAGDWGEVGAELGVLEEGEIVPRRQSPPPLLSAFQDLLAGELPQVENQAPPAGPERRAPKPSTPSREKARAKEKAKAKNLKQQQRKERRKKKK